jgi:hypothetical protein
VISLNRFEQSYGSYGSINAIAQKIAEFITENLDCFACPALEICDRCSPINCTETIKIWLLKDIPE